MAHVEVDPEELLLFANQLQSFDKAVEDALKTLGSQFAHLSNTWRDQKQRDFSDSLQMITAQFGEFSKESEDMQARLRAAAEDLKSYERR